MASVRFRRGEGEFVAVGRYDIATVWDAKDAVEWAKAVAESPEFVRLADRGFSRDKIEVLAARLLRGDVLIVRMRQPARLLDGAPEITNLSDLVGDTEDTRPRDTESWIAIHVVDQRGRPLPFFRARVQDPSGTMHSTPLDPGARGRVSKIPSDGSCSVVLEVDPTRDS